MNHVQNLMYIKEMVEQEGFYFGMPSEGGSDQPKELSKSQLKKLNKKNWIDGEKAGADKRGKEIDPEEIEKWRAAKAAEKAAKAQTSAPEKEEKEEKKEKKDEGKKKKEK